MAQSKLDGIEQKWRSQWPAALAIWSQFVKLKDPIWCHDKKSEQQQQLTGSFAMIRLNDHSIVIGLREVLKNGLGDFGLEILAHEVGHHVYCPADLTDNARLTARIRAGIPTKEHLAGFVSNLYSDLLINDRLERGESLDIAGVYKKLIAKCPDSMWTLYMRIYEILWSRPKGELASGKITDRLNQDAALGARLIRSYATQWLDGAGRFAALCLPYLIDDDAERMQKQLAPWLDTQSAGCGCLPDGLTTIDPYEAEGAIHPSEDPELSGLANTDSTTGDSELPTGANSTSRKSVKAYRDPVQYTAILRAAGVDLDDAQIVANYYRERALPHLISFPSREQPSAVDPIPEGLEVWDVGDPLADIDWMGTMLNGQTVIPGITTRRRLVGTSLGENPERLPIDLYLGVDCSGSMGNPASHLSYPVLAGAIIALSAIRTGSKVKVVLSGEPGKTISTDGFSNQSNLVMKTLTDYLGTGYAFGIHRLAETFGDDSENSRPIHILIVSDNDTFSMLDSDSGGSNGWAVAEKALAQARGGGTFVLELPEYVRNRKWAEDTDAYLDKICAMGWNVNIVSSMEQLIEFAKQFSHQNYSGRNK